MPRQIKVSPVRQMLNGKTIAVYETRNIASVATGIDLSSIRQACKGSRKSAGGYSWQPARLSNNLARAKKLAMIVQKDADGKIRGHYRDVKIASMATGIKASYIQSALRGRVKTAGGFSWF